MAGMNIASSSGEQTVPDFVTSEAQLDAIYGQIVWRFQVDGNAPKTTHLLGVRPEA